MSKAKKGKSIVIKDDHYEYVRAIVSEGEVTWEYKMPNCTESCMSHDEDVGDFTEKDIIALIRAMLSMKEDEPVEVIYM